MSYANVCCWIGAIKRRIIVTFISVCCYFPSTLGARPNNPLATSSSGKKRGFSTTKCTENRLFNYNTFNKHFSIKAYVCSKLNVSVIVHI